MEDQRKGTLFNAERATVLVRELRESFSSGKTKSYEWRVSQLESIAKMVDHEEKQIIEALHKDLSKPEFETFVSEISMAKSSCKLALKELNRWMLPEKAKTSMTTYPSSAEIVSEPLGIVLIISTWNYPFCMLDSSLSNNKVKELTIENDGNCDSVVALIEHMGAKFRQKVFLNSKVELSDSSDIDWEAVVMNCCSTTVLSLDPVVGAIAAGNAVVLKPSEIAPATSSLLAKLLEEYVDNSVIRVVEGAVAETSTLLEQKWDKIFYTGSARVGRIVMAAAAKHLTPVILELGGKCPVVVDSEVNLQVTVRRIIAGKWGCNNGQACIAPDYIVTTKAFVSKLIDALKYELDEFFGKDHMESKDLSRIVNSYHFARLIKILDEDKVSDKIVLGGQRDENQLKIAPTILLNVPEDSLIMKEEIFGPLLPILTVENLEESFDMINSKSKPLAAYLFTNNRQLKKDFVKKVSAGGMLINDTILHVTISTLPFGGVGESGMGSYHGKFSFDAFSHKKAVLYRSFDGDSSTRYPPYTSGKLRLLKALMNGNLFGLILALMGGSKD